MSEPTNAIDYGYARLAAWQAAQPTNFFTADRNLQRTLELRMGTERYRQAAPHLYRFGSIAATSLDAAARTSNERVNLPRLRRFGDLGERLEQVEYHPTYHEAGRYVYGSGAMAVLEKPGNNLLALALFYLSAQNGEAGHNCPLACTAGLIKVLQRVGSAELRALYLPRLLDPGYDTNYTGAQFLTEVQGGSDVGANATTATPVDGRSGVWRLNGRKWFCSNVTADVALVTARVPEQGDGTRGLGLFLVPRLVDGQPNGMVIDRLKEKLGTASLATAEVTFHDALAYQVGAVTEGFKNVMRDVINTSRIYNAVATSANARRAYLTAWTYAQTRTAFGQPILHFALVQDILTKMRCDATALASGSFHIARMLDDLELGAHDDDLEQCARVAINLNKYRSAVIAHEVINAGIELLGGNGTIESFSVLPRLLRDNVVYENWEGPHNVLMAQVERDFRRYEMHKPFLNLIGGLFQKALSAELKQAGSAALDQISAELNAVLALSADHAAVFFRPLMDRLIDLYYTACMATEAGQELALHQDRSKERMAQFFFHRRVVPRPLSQWSDYPEWVARLCADSRPWKISRDDQFDGMDDPIWE